MKALKRLLSLGCTSGALLLLIVSPAAAVENKFDVTHLYNAAHSLTGGCLTSKADEVKDPACLETPQGPLPPEGPLVAPIGVAVDADGNQYVVNHNESKVPGSHIDIFDPNGHYIGGLEEPKARRIAVDSRGYLYVSDGTFNRLVRYDPIVYKPEAGEIEYGSVPVVIRPTAAEEIAVDLTTDHFYLSESGESEGTGKVYEYGPPTDGAPNELLSSIGKGVLNGEDFPGSIAIDAAHDKIYVGDHVNKSPNPSQSVVRVFSRQSPHQLLNTIDGSTTPAGTLGTVRGLFKLTVDEASGNFFAWYQSRIYELEPNGTYVATIQRPSQEGLFNYLAYDNSPLSPNQGYLYVSTGEGLGHLYAYEPFRAPEPPTVESTGFEVVGEDEALLKATVNPAGQVTHYSFEVTTQADFEANAFANAQPAGEGDIPASGEGVAVSGVTEGLTPGAAYRFRVMAENQCKAGGCVVEAQREFSTFPHYTQSGASCPNQALRSGSSAYLPDCRAYELVTPANTGGRAPFAINESGTLFATWTASPEGNSIAFKGEGGAYPGQNAPGAYNGDAYVSRRGAGGWSTAAAGLSARQSSAQLVGGMSPDHGFTAVRSRLSGNLESELGAPGDETDYIRYPDGSVRLLGEGSIGQTKDATARYISYGGTHILFTASTQLEPAAGPGGIYDRTLDGTLHVVSLLPGEITPSGASTYEGVSADGSVVAFEVGNASSLYLRLDNTETVQGAPAGSTFAGLSADGRYLFYLQGGDLYRFDSQESTTERLTEAGGFTPAYVPATGTSAYFTTNALLGGGPNPQGAEPQAGKPNLYRWEEGQVAFIATLTEADMKESRGFAAWLAGINSFGRLPLRATPDGRTLLFESHADLTDFTSDGRKQIYRYDANQNSLACVSCNPTQKTPSSDAVLLTLRDEAAIPVGVPAGSPAIVPNLSSDGRRAFFESTERLVPADENSLRDVYQWEDEGKGSCAKDGGCLSLITSGTSGRDNYLYGVSETGDDVFIYTSELLNGEDIEEAPSIYDARAGGGFPPPSPPAAECQGEACQPAASAPGDPTPILKSAGNVGKEKPARCPKGKHRRRGGKQRCVPRHAKHNNQAKAKRRAHR